MPEVRGWSRLVAAMCVFAGLGCSRDSVPGAEPCLSGARRCEGQLSRLCSAGQWESVAVECAHGCNPGTGECLEGGDPPDAEDAGESTADSGGTPTSDAPDVVEVPDGDDAADVSADTEETPDPGPVCVPDCAGAECGADDGCEGICLEGSCDHGQICEEGFCVCPGGEELCNGEDDDCDGATDEDFAEKGDECTAGEGACQGAGTRECSADGLGLECTAVGKPPTMLCDDVDPCTHADACTGGADSYCAGTAYQCEDDGLECTTASCDGQGGCTHLLSDGACLVEGICASSLAAKPGDPCHICDPATSTSSWTASPVGTECDDANACTGSDACLEGACAGAPEPACNDGNACTQDSCEPASGCVFQPTGEPCDDGEACTADDACTTGEAPHCAGSAHACEEDDLGCTAAECDGEGGCEQVLAAGSCLIGGECVEAAALSPVNPCHACDPSITTVTWVNVVDGTGCDDDDQCTVDDGCAGGACKGAPGPACDDANPCTDDSCEAATGCVTEPNAAGCDDSNACTLDESCSNSSCVASEEVACDDGDACTDDECDPASGDCVFAPSDIDCADGDPCTDDGCDSATGACTHGPAAACNLTPCPAEGECAAGSVCDDASGACVSCLTDADCDEGLVCVAKACVDGIPCQSTVQCKATDQVCDVLPEAGHCVDCLEDAHCGASEACLMQECVAAQPCATHKDCDLVCAEGLGFCVACNTSADCPAGTWCGADHECQLPSCQQSACEALWYHECKPDGSGYAAPEGCDDGNPCTVDSCTPLTGCTHVGMLDGVPCDDGQACAGDVCQGAECIGKPGAFEVVFGEAGWQEVDWLEEISPGTYLGVGEAGIYSDVAVDIWVFALGSAGQLEWSTSIGGAAKEFATSATSDGEGGVLLSGYSQAGSVGTPLLARVSAAGDVVWSKTSTTELGPSAWVYEVARLPSGEYVAAGTSKPAGAVVSRRTLWRLSASGEVLETNAIVPKSVGETGCGDGSINELVVTAGGAVFVSGSTGKLIPPSGNCTVCLKCTWLASIDPVSLSVLGEYEDCPWVPGVCTHGASAATTLAALPDGDLLFARSNGAGGQEVARLDPGNFTPTWLATVEDSTHGNNFRFLPTEDGPVHATSFGYTAQTLGKQDGLRWELDPETGDVSEPTRYGGAGSDYLWSLASTSDGGLIAAGHNGSHGSLQQAWALKWDPDDNTACPCTEATPAEVCDDGNPCTADSCEAGEGCVYTTLYDVPCEDGDLVTSGEVCASGSCEGGCAEWSPIAEGSTFRRAQILSNGSVRLAVDSDVLGVSLTGDIVWGTSLSNETCPTASPTSMAASDDGELALVYTCGGTRFRQLTAAGEQVHSLVLDKAAFNAVQPGVDLELTVHEVGWWSSGLPVVYYSYRGDDNQRWLRAVTVGAGGQLKPVFGKSLNDYYKTKVRSVRRGAAPGSFSYVLEKPQIDQLVLEHFAPLWEVELGSTDVTTSPLAALTGGGALYRTDALLRFDDQGQTVWELSPAWLADVTAAAELAGDVWVLGAKKLAEGQNTGWMARLDESGAVEHEVLLGIDGIFPIQDRVKAAGEATDRFVVLGQTDYQAGLTPKGATIFRAELDLGGALLCAE